MRIVIEAADERVVLPDTGMDDYVYIREQDPHTGERVAVQVSRHLPTGRRLGPVAQDEVLVILNHRIYCIKKGYLQDECPDRHAAWAQEYAVRTPQPGSA